MENELSEKILKVPEDDERASVTSGDVSEEEVDDDAKIEKSAGNFSLHYYAREGAVDKVKLLFKKWKSLYSIYSPHFKKLRDKRNVEGFSALHLAARYNRKNIVAFLLEVGASINERETEYMNTPLLLAVKYDMTSTAMFLVSKGADVTASNTYGTTVLHFASRRGNKKLVAKLLEEHQNLVEAEDNAHATPLHSAMTGGCAEVVSLLLGAGANVFAKNNEGEMPIHYAASEDAGDLIVMLIKKALAGTTADNREKMQRDYVNCSTDEKETALHIAAQAGNEETVKTLISVGAEVNRRTVTKSTPLHLATVSGQKEVVSYLIMHGANVNSKDATFMTPLHKACQFGRLDTVKYLIERGASIEARDKDNFTPLMCAVWKGQNEVIDYLLNDDAKIDVTDSGNRNLMHLAIDEGHWELLTTILKHDGINLVNGVDKDYRTPLHYAAANDNQEALDLLINNGAHVDISDNEEKSPLHLAASNGQVGCVEALGISAPGVINSTDERGRAALHHAAINGHFDVLKSLIQMGAETSSRDDINWTPLDYAARNGYCKSMAVLLDNDAPVDACDKNFYTPLHHASCEGHVECVVLLLDYGASIDLETVEKKNCLDLAVECFQKEVCMAIIKHKRWREALCNTVKEKSHPLEKLIQVAPDVVEVVLNNSITYDKRNKQHEDYSIKYDFELLDLDPNQLKYSNRFFAPTTMVKFQRDKLLCHPLIVKLIHEKWAHMGRWAYFISLFIYLLFVSLLTALVVTERMSLRNKAGPVKCTERSSSDVIAWMTLIVAGLQILKELIQVFYLGRAYLRDPVNIFEFLLYFTTALFMVPFIACQLNQSLDGLESMKWQAGAISILLAWANLLLYMKRLPFFGLYIVMFTEVLSTMVEVLAVFSVLITGFAFSFYVLLDAQSAYSDVGRVFVKMIIMMIGELEFDSTFTENFLHHNKTNLIYKGMSLFIFVLFLIIMLIVIMNLLVGLAVGDIESVRKNAYLRILESQVHVLGALEYTYPRFILRRFYKSHYVHRPNKRRWYKKIVEWFRKYDHKALKEEQSEMGGKDETIMQEIQVQKVELSKQKDKIKNVMTLMEEQLHITKRLKHHLNAKK